MTAQAHIPPIQYPASMQPVNKHLLESIASAHKCMLHLVDEYRAELHSVEIGPRNPVVWIQPPPDNRLGDMETGQVMECRNGYRRTIMVTLCKGCQVQWRVRCAR